LSNFPFDVLPLDVSPLDDGAWVGAVVGAVFAGWLAFAHPAMAVTINATSNKEISLFSFISE